MMLFILERTQKCQTCIGYNEFLPGTKVFENY